jgi:hypothetical protein
MNYIKLLILIAFFLFNCKGKKALDGAFKIVNLEVNLPKNSALEDTTKQIDYIEILGNETFINFSEKDSLFLLNNKGVNLFGKYKYNENDTTEIKFDNNCNLKIAITFEKDEETNEKFLLCNGFINNRLPVQLLLKKDDYFISSEINLLDIGLNWWRKRPSKNEDNEKIKARTISQIDYSIKYFELINDNKYDAFNVKVMCSPFRFYANGIGLVDNPSYFNIFYDYSNANLANEKLKAGLKSISNYPESSENYSIGYISVLKQIKAIVKRSN